MINIQKSLFFVFLCLIVNGIYAQQSTTDPSFIRKGNGNSEVIPESSVNTIVEDLKKSEYRPDGFRVQITGESGNGSQQRANEVRNKYHAKHKEHNVYIIWESPNFKVRVGDFKTKFEAAAYWKKIQNEFPESYVVEDKLGSLNKK